MDPAPEAGERALLFDRQTHDREGAGTGRGKIVSLQHLPAALKKSQMRKKRGRRLQWSKSSVATISNGLFCNAMLPRGPRTKRKGNAGTTDTARIKMDTNTPS